MSRTSRGQFVLSLGTGAVLASSLPIEAKSIARAIAQVGNGVSAKTGPTAAELRRMEIIERTRARLDSIPLDYKTDAAVRLSQTAINKFFATHYAKNKQFYVRDRAGGKPVHEFLADDHGKERKISFYLSVLPEGARQAVSISLIPSSDAQRKYDQWAAQHYMSSDLSTTLLPSNVVLTAPHVLLQIDIPALTPGEIPHRLDTVFSVTAGAYVQLVDEPQGTHSLKLTDFDIELAPLGSGVDQPYSVPVGAPAICVEIANMLRDAVIIGGNVALTQLTSGLVRSLPLPPIDIIDSAVLTPNRLRIKNGAIELSATLSRGSIREAVVQQFTAESARLAADMQRIDFADALASDATDPVNIQVHQALRNVDERFEALQRASNSAKPTNHSASSDSRAAVDGADLTIELSKDLINSVATHFLQANAADCTRWLHTPEVPAAPFFNGRGCYQLVVSNAEGHIQPPTGTQIEMSCHLFASGTVDVQVCEWNPCGDALCSPTVTFGLGLDGPTSIDVQVSHEWYDNTALRLNAHLSRTPGFIFIGAPPGIDRILNMLLEALTAPCLRVFTNAILAVLNELPLIRISKTVPKTNVSVKVSDYQSYNDQGLLAIGGNFTFS